MSLALLANVDVNTLLPERDRHGGGPSGPQTCDFAGQAISGSFLRRGCVCKRRVLTWLAQFDFLDTLLFPLTLAPKPFTVYSYGFARLPQIAASLAPWPMIALPSGTNLSHRAFLRITASSQFLLRLLLGKSCSWFPFMPLMLQRPHTEIHAWWIRFDELVAAWKLQFSSAFGRLEWACRIRPLVCCRTRSRGTEHYRPSVASVVPLPCLLASMQNELSAGQVAPTVLGPGNLPMEEQDIASITLRCLRHRNTCRSRPAIVLLVTLSMGSIDPVVTATRILLPTVRDVQPIVRRRPVAFRRDLPNDAVACSVFQMTRSPSYRLCPWTTDPHTLAELLSRGIIACAKEAFPLDTKPRKDSVSAKSWNIITSRRQARTIVLGARHQLRCAALSLTFADVGSAHFCCQCSGGGSAGFSHETCLCTRYPLQ